MQFANSLKVLFGLLVLNALFYDIEADRSKRSPSPFYQYFASRLSGLVSPMSPVIGRITVGEIGATASSAAVLTKSSISAMDKVNFVLNSLGEIAGKTTTTTVQPKLKIDPFRKMPMFKRAAFIELGGLQQNENTSTITAQNDTNANLKLVQVQNLTEVNNDNNVKKNRSRRFSVAAVLAPAARMAGFATTIIAAGAATSAIDSEIRKSYALEAEERLVRKTFDCAKNNYGCFERLCWANCGPRMNAADWCVTSNGENFKNGTAKPTPCESHKDCNSCWVCATHCKLEGFALNPASGFTVSKTP